MKDTTAKTAANFEQDFKELSIYLDVLCKNGHDVKDAGHTWIAFTDKFADFRKRILAAVALQYSSINLPAKTAEEICDKWIYHTPMIPLREAVIYAMEEYRSQPSPSISDEAIEAKAYLLYPLDVPAESPGDQCKNHHYRQAYIYGFKSALRQSPISKEERVRIAGEAWGASEKYGEALYNFNEHGVLVIVADKEQYLSTIK